MNSRPLKEKKDGDMNPSWLQVVRRKIWLLINPPDTRKPSKEAVEYAGYILNHYSRDSHGDISCLARDLERHGWKAIRNKN